MNLFWKEKKILHNNHRLYFLMGSHYYYDGNLLHKINLISTSYWITLFHQKYFQNMNIVSNVFQINNFKQYWYVP